MSRAPYPDLRLRPCPLSLRRSSSRDWDSDELESPTSSTSSVDEDEINKRLSPYWPKYRALFKSRGFQLDTVKDVKHHYGPQAVVNSVRYISSCHRSRQGENLHDDDALCPDAGLPDNLFRGRRVSDCKRIVVKAVHAGSREHKIIRVLTSPPLNNDPMNHTILHTAVLDIFEVSCDEIAFIVMEEWSSQLITESGACCLSNFFAALRQCIEHVVFLHRHRIAHLDISLRNLVTDFNGHYAYIDYELSRHFEGNSVPMICNYRGTEVPPECESGAPVDPYKIDVWALAVLMLRACKLTGYWVPDFMSVIQPMLHEDPAKRPTLAIVLVSYDRFLAALGNRRMPADCH